MAARETHTIFFRVVWCNVLLLIALALCFQSAVVKADEFGVLVVPPSNYSSGPTITASPSPFLTGSPSSSSTETPTCSVTPTSTSTSSVSGTVSPSSSVSSSVTATTSVSPSSSGTTTTSVTETPTSSLTPTSTSSVSGTVTPSSSVTATSSPTLTPTSSFTSLPLPRPCYEYANAIEALPLVPLGSEFIDVPLVIAGEPWFFVTSSPMFLGPMPRSELTYSGLVTSEGQVMDWLYVSVLPNVTELPDKRNEEFGHSTEFKISLTSSLTRQAALQLPETLTAAINITNDCREGMVVYTLLNIYISPDRVGQIPSFTVHEGEVEEFTVGISELLKFVSDPIGYPKLLRNVSLTNGEEFLLNDLSLYPLSPVVHPSAEPDSKFDPRLPELGENVSSWITLGSYDNIQHGFKVRAAAPLASAPLLTRIRLVFKDAAPTGPVFFYNEFNLAVVRDCVTTLATRLTECSRQCGGGTYLKARQVITPPLGLAIGAEKCLPETVSLKCNTFSCADLPRFLFSLTFNEDVYNSYPVQIVEAILNALLEMTEVDAKDIDIHNATLNSQTRQLTSEEGWPHFRSLESLSTVTFVIEMSFPARDFENEPLEMLRTRARQAREAIRNGVQQGLFEDLVRQFIAAFADLEFGFVLDFTHKLGGRGITNTRPVAIPMVFFLPDDACEQVIGFHGRDNDGDSLTFYIRSGPETMRIAQLSQVFSDFGYSPKEGEPIHVPSSGNEDPILVNDQQGRFLYITSDEGCRQKGQMINFLAFDGKEFSLPTWLWVVPNTGVIVKSDFLLDAENWSVVQNGFGDNSNIVHAPYSDGLLFKFVFGKENLIRQASQFSAKSVPVVPPRRVFSETIDVSEAVRKERKEEQHSTMFNDSSIWYFSAPDKFTQDISLAFDGVLQFTLGALEGDFNEGRLHTEFPLVRILCSTCSVNGTVEYGYFANRTLKMGISNLLRGSIEVNVPLSPSKWLKRPLNPLQKWTKPEDCKFLLALTELDELQILGDLTAGHEATSLGHVHLIATETRPVPLKCQDIPPPRDLFAPDDTSSLRLKV